MKSIATLTKQYEKELELVQKHKDKAKAIADQIKYMQGEECSNRISKLNLTPEQYDRMLRLLNDKTGVMDALDLVVPMEQDKTEESHTEYVGPQERDEDVIEGEGAEGDEPTPEDL